MLATGAAWLGAAQPWWANFYPAPGAPAAVAQSPYGWPMPPVAASAGRTALSSPNESATAAGEAQMRPEAPGGGRACLAARNYLNTQYTVPLRIGATSFWVVPDSGSFEVLVPAASCEACTCVAPSYACCSGGKGSKATYRPLAPAELAALPPVDVTFGQGKVRGALVHDDVQLGGLVARNQSVLLATRHSIAGYCDSSYDGVLGLGHRRHARDGDADLSLLASLRLASYSICFGRHEGEGGRLELGGEMPELAGRYRHVPVIGRRHWAVQLSGVGFGGTAACAHPPHCGAIVDSGTSLIAGPHAHVRALLDQLGTSVADDCSNIDELPPLKLELGAGDSAITLELAPRFYVTRTRDAPGDDATGDEPASPAYAASPPPGGSARAPRGAESFARSADTRDGGAPRGGAVLAPHQQLQQRDGEAPHRFAMSDAAPRNASGAPAPDGAGREHCMVVFMELNMNDVRHGPVWILGMPFLRAYSAQFSRAPTSPADAPAGAPAGAPAEATTGLSIGFAEVAEGTDTCAGCPPAPGDRRSARLGALSLAATHPLPPHTHAHGEEHTPLSVSLSHARLPSWAARAATGGLDAPAPYTL